jgi:methylthioribulose-1-phosphate dehydratase
MENERKRRSLVLVNDEKSMRETICYLLRSFYDKGWMSGTGGGICSGFDKDLILVAPTRVHKEMIKQEDLFVVNSQYNTVSRHPKDKSLRLSECAPIFCEIIRKRSAGSVLHSHALSTILAADLAGNNDCLVISGLEMLKGISGENNRSQHFIPIINNTEYEKDLCTAIEKTLGDERFSKSFCILIRDHGAYIWGKDILETKRHAEVYHFLFEAIIARKQRKLN